jgi:hypothetical protein
MGIRWAPGRVLDVVVKIKNLTPLSGFEYRVQPVDRVKNRYHLQSITELTITNQPTKSGTSKWKLI